MTIQTVPIASLCADPANVRRHPAKNQQAIAASLKRFGQQKPIVVDAAGVVRAGNGTLAAAIALGWTDIQIVQTPLHGSEATAFAIADNRSAELAEWDDEALDAQLQSLRAEGLDLKDLGFDPDDLDRLSDAEKVGDEQTPGAEQWLVVITCQDEADQLAVLGEMKQQGRECRAVVG